ncbi:hypothetical protein RYX36_023068 [Vicia faba]
MIESLAKIRQYQIMWELVNSMRKKGTVNITAFNGLLRALCMSRNVRKAQEIFHSMKGPFEPNSKSYSILIEGRGKEPNTPKAREVFGEMVSAGCNPNTVIYGINVQNPDNTAHSYSYYLKYLQENNVS